MKSKPIPSITLPLDEFISIYLRDSHYEPIYSNNLAIVLDELCTIAIKQGEFVGIVVWDGDSLIDDKDKGTKLPHLWKYGAWASSSEKWVKQQERSNRERVERFIFEHNTKLVAKALKEQCLLDDTRATATAYGIVKRGREFVVKYLNVKLITKEEEL